MRIIDRFQIDNTACVYSENNSLVSCDNISDGGTVMYDHYGLELNEVDNSSVAHLFPNPANEECAISLSGQWTDNVQVLIYDVQGKLAFDELQSSLNFTIQTKGFANGLYFVELNDGVNKLMKKLTVVH